MTNLASNLVTTAQAHPDKVAIKLDDAELTWSQLHGLAAQAAGSLRAAGLEPGDRVSLILPNIPAFPVLFYGTLLAGGVVVPVYETSSPDQVAWILADSEEQLMHRCDHAVVVERPAHLAPPEPAPGPGRSQSSE